MYCNYEKQGNKYIIKEIYETPIEIIKEVNRRNAGNYKEYKELNIKQNEWDNIGIYYILKDNDIYIGSTFSGFRKRFRKHYNGDDKKMIHTYELLQSGGIFNILHDMTGIKDEPLIRQLENEYIQYAINNTNYNVINKKENAWSYLERIQKYKTIRIKKEYYNKAIQLLVDNGLIKSINNSLDIIQENNFDINNIEF